MASLRYAREQRNLLADAVSRKIGKGNKAVGQYERGYANPPYSVLKKWCSVVGMELTVKPARNAHV